MKCTERELREVIRFVIAKNSKYTMNESLTYQKRDLIFEEVLKEISLKQRLGVILAALMPLMSGCDINDLYSGTVHPDNIAVAQAVNNTFKNPDELDTFNKMVVQTNNENKPGCYDKVTYEYLATYNPSTGVYTGGINSGNLKPKWERICNKNKDAQKLLDIVTNEDEMNELGNGVFNPDSKIDNLAKNQLEKDISNGTCEIGNDGIRIYTPLCSGGKVDSATLTDDDIVVGKKVSAEDLNQADSDKLNDFLESLKRMIMSSDFEWKNNRNLILVGIKNPNHSLYKGLDINKIDKLHNDWVKKGNNEAAIDKYINGDALNSFTDGMMKDNLSVDKSNETW